jgi:hypothetical protein
MRFYVDDLNHSNLHELSDGPHPLTFDNTNAFHSFKQAGFEIAETNEYDNPGIYLVSVRCYAETWSGKERYGPPRHVLYEIPLDVIQAARKGKVLIVIDNQSEGFPLIRETINGLVDGFFELHEAIKNLHLPRYSVILVDNNSWFSSQYEQWCINNRQKQSVAHVYFLTGFFYFQDRIPKQPLILDALKSSDSKDFNSLNRTARNHRIDHLYYLITKNLAQHGLVSGNYRNDPNSTQVPPSTVLNIDDDQYKNTLTKNLPLIVDKDFTVENPDFNNETIFNHSIYKNSLLSFVTETAFQQPGMFITEKTFKPIVAGHPFIILGQYNILKELRSMGYQTDFPGLDQSYDDIQSPVDRFYAAHESLTKWVNTSRKHKESFIRESLKMVKQNQLNYMQHDYVYESHKRLFNTVEEIFSGKYKQR